MLMGRYRKEVFRPKCNSNFESLHCIAHLEGDIGEVLPYLNTALGGYGYIAEPPAVTFKVHGKLITLHARRIAINALKDEEEADKILEWLKEEINVTWQNRREIQPSYKSPPKPRILEILKLLPKSNCRKCGQLTCMVFASLAAEGVKDASDCPDLKNPNKTKLEKYLESFCFDL